MKKSSDLCNVVKIPPQLIDNTERRSPILGIDNPLHRLTPHVRGV